MRYVTSVERLAELRTRRKVMVEMLEERFGPVPNPLIQQLEEISEAKILSDLNKQAVTISSFEAFQQALTAIISG